VRWRGADIEDSTWEAAPLVAVAAPAALLRFFRLNGRCLRRSLAYDQQLDAAASGLTRAHLLRAPLSPALWRRLLAAWPALRRRPLSRWTLTTSARSRCPDQVSGTSVRYQLEGLNWLLDRYHARTSACLADEMGLGKTARAIPFARHCTISSA